MDHGHLIYEAMVVGGGPAGLSAALQLARFNRRVIVFDSGIGRSTFHQVNHNYPGFPGGIAVRDLRQRMQDHLAPYPVPRIDASVTAIAREGDRFCAETTNGDYRARRVILATGVCDRFPAFEGWEQFVGRSIFWCIVCDGYSTRGRRVLVAGNDDDAGVTALQFLQFTSRVQVVTNDDECRIGEPVRHALEAHAIPVTVARIAAVRGDDGILGRVECAEGSGIEADMLFSLQGCSPNSELAAGLGVRCNADGYIIADMEQRTNVEGVFAAGDVTRDLAHQVATAVHEGLTAAVTTNYSLYADWQRHETYA